MALIHVSLLLFGFIAPLVTSDPTCFFPNHQPAENFTTCNAAAEEAACCRPEDVCLSNGYCLQQSASLPNRLMRGACTDYTFSNRACPSKCADTAPTTAVTIYLARDNGSTGGDFCCVSNYNVTSGLCLVPSRGSGSAGYAPFALGQGTVIYDREKGSLLPQTWNDSLKVPAATVTVIPESSSGISSSAIISVAVPLGVLLLAALAGCLVLWRQLRKAKAETANARGSDWSDGKASKHDNYGYASAVGYVSVSGDKSDHLQHHPEVPNTSMQHFERQSSQRYFAEAPTETEPQMADSRSVGR